ncbi:unnamed protein product [Rotaria sp. Silwood2]|nr:unnamed protein product [Rotaria sp. Silwood2]
MPENDILPPPARQPDYASCCSQCQATLECIAFTYSPSNQQCSLKKSIGGGGNPTGDKISGYNPDKCGGFVRKDKWDIPGNDILSSPVEQPDYASCCSQCQAIFGCIAFTYSSSSYGCSLKTSIGSGGNSSDDRISGYNPDKCGGFVRKDKWDIPGNDILSSPVKRPDYASCCSKCQATSGCMAFTYSPSSQQCSLKTSIDSGINTADDTITGYLLISNIPVDAQWVQNGVTVAGGNEPGNATNQLDLPKGLFIDDDQMMVIADYYNDRIIQWKMGDTNGQIVAGKNGSGNQLNQLSGPTDVLIEKETDSLIICDWGNGRVVQWSRRSGTTQGEILIDSISCHGLAMDDQKYLYISDVGKNEVKRYRIGDKNITIVAGGNGQGDGLNQLHYPVHIFVDRQQTVYMSDNWNFRVMKWNKGAKEGIVVAGGQGEGNAPTQLSSPTGLFVDTLGTVYVADLVNYRVIRWSEGAKQGTIIVGGNGQGARENQLNYPESLSFDRHGNLYVVDSVNARVQRFSIQ